MKDNKIVFSKQFDCQELIINLIDIGARGDISLPWNLFSERNIRVIGFEPDKLECDRLRMSYPEREYYFAALWGEKAKRPFYQCKAPSTSSMYPINEASNRDYHSTHWEGRIVNETKMVECVSLDAVLQTKHTPDFIKIDTQGSEYEVLRGAENILRENAPLVLVETWCEEVYLGAPLAHDVMKYMSQLGYRILDIGIAAAWKHNTIALPDAYCKRKIIGLDILFAKEIKNFKFRSEYEVIKFAGLTELFGFRDYAVAALERCSCRSENTIVALANLIENDRKDRMAVARLRRFIGKILFGSDRLTPPLH